MLEVKVLHAQAGAAWTEAQIADVARAIQRCAAWHATPQVRITQTRPAKLAVALRRAVRAIASESEAI